MQTINCPICNTRDNFVSIQNSASENVNDTNFAGRKTQMVIIIKC